MAARAKFKLDQEVEFRFAGSNFVGVIGLVRKEGSSFKYSVIDDEGTTYPVAEFNILRKL